MTKKEQEHLKDNSKPNQNRRKLIHAAWSTPVIASVVLPVHAMTSEAGHVRTELSPCNWDGFAWQELNPSEQSLWGVLGWNEDNWNNGPPPPSDSMAWDNLSGAQNGALMTLGFTQNDWDNFSQVCG